MFSAGFPGLIDLVATDDGKVAYLIKNENGLNIVDSYEQDDTILVPPKKDKLPFLLARGSEVIKYSNKPNDKKLFKDIISYLSRFSRIGKAQRKLLACKVLLSYLQDHPDVHYMPIITFYATPERGKSRTGKAITYIAYRGIHAVDIREANIFRWSENLKATIFFDMMNLWKKVEKSGSEDIILQRYEKGAKASRVLSPEKGPFEDTKYFAVFGPTLIATNESMHRILETRCIQIQMPNAPGNYEDADPTKGLALKERLVAWRAKNIDKKLPEVHPIKNVTGRLWDISKPLLQMYLLNMGSHIDGLEKLLQKIAFERAEVKNQTIEGQIVTTLAELCRRQGELGPWKIMTGDVLKELNSDRREGHTLTSQYLGKKLKAMGIATNKHRGYSVIRLNRSDLKVLGKPYNVRVPKKHSTTRTPDGPTTTDIN